MSKNITIKEDGTAKSMSSVSLLNLKLQSGGGSDWVPEDETPLAKIDITHNGEYVASADGYYGYGLVRVNVAGGAGAEQSGTAPSTIEDGGYTVSDYDPAIDVQPYEFQQPEIGGIGSSITGISPYTGEWQNVSVDADGNLTWEGMDPLPHAITIVKGPHKKSYLDGETIDLTGIQVRLLNENGSIFADKDHPYGIVKREELLFPVTVATYDEEAQYIDRRETISYEGVELHGPISWGYSHLFISERQFYEKGAFLGLSTYGGVVLVTFSSAVTDAQYEDFRVTLSSNGTTFLIVAPFSFTLTTRVAALSADGKVVDASYVTVASTSAKAADGCYYTTFDSFGYCSSPLGTFPTIENPPSGYWSALAKYIMFGDGFDNPYQIPVQWMRGDGQTLEDSFEITVAKLDGSFSGGGGGGFGDNGGGGAF